MISVYVANVRDYLCLDVDGQNVENLRTMYQQRTIEDLTHEIHRIRLQYWKDVGRDVDDKRKA